jgi:TRAP-type mannitol/chloroaromatic compound transport system permease small subunit
MSSPSHADAGALPETMVSRVIGRFITTIGDGASWLWLVLVLVIIGQVLLRYVFGQGSILLEELQWHIYGIGFLLGIGYCLQADRHVRIDVVAERFSPRTRAAIEVAGILIFLLPFAIGVTIEGGKLAYTAWHLSETSASPGGLPYRWVIKAFIPLGFALIALAAFARLTRCAALLFGFPKPILRD